MKSKPVRLTAQLLLQLRRRPLESRVRPAEQSGLNRPPLISLLLRLGAQLGVRVRAAAPAANAGITVEDIRAIKELAERLGADKVKELTEVLGR